MEAAAARPVIRVAAICGSLRKASYNGGLLRAAAEVCEESIPGLRVEHIDISGLPLLNTDLEIEWWRWLPARRRGLPRQGPPGRLLPLRIAGVQLLHRKYVCVASLSVSILSICDPL
ncbi:hypothetical protein ABZP36_025723 [Zizania latifolia]